MSKVSVFMPVYNAEQYLAEAIDSVIHQSFTDWELIIGNDGSTDGTEEIVKSYSDPRIKYFCNSENKGHTLTKYLMLEHASGEYIAFLDADDVALKNRFQLQVDFLDNNPEYGLCGTWGTMIDGDGDILQQMKYPTGYEYLRCALLFNTSFLQSSIMVKKQLMIDFYYDPEILLVEDYNFECLVAKESKVENLKKTLVEYRWHDSNISNTKQEVLKNLNKKIYQRELVNIGIYASDFELDLHNAIRDKSTQTIKNKLFFRELRKWMKKLAGANLLCRIYDRDIFLATLAFRWIYACKERNAFFKLLRIPVVMNYKQWTILFRMIAAKKS